VTYSFVKYATVHFFKLYKSGHNPIRMFFFHIQALYNIFSLVFSWFALANLWLTFAIIIELLPTQNLIAFGTTEITHWVNFALKGIYLCFLALQFVLALGNRPKGERGAYVVTLWVYAFISLYLLICSFWLAGTAFARIPETLKNKTTAEVVKSFFTPPIGALIAAAISTFGIYLVASCLYRDPWHMGSSFLQYLLLAPSFTNVLNVYAFCNLHDVSWGTKGSDKAEALPSVSSKKGKDEEPAVVEDTTREQGDLDDQFKETVQRAVTKLVVKEVVEKPTMDDQNKTFRTRLVSVWMLTNAILAITIQNINGLKNTSDPEADEEALRSKQNLYFAIILYSTFGLSLVRFIGCLYYWLRRNLFRCCRRN